jgi:hypothetical protein
VPARLRRGTRRCALYKALTLSALRAQRRLDAVGFVWEKPSQTEAWDAFYAQLLVPAPKAPPPPAAPPHPPSGGGRSGAARGQEYRAAHGHVEVAQAEGRLGTWVARQRRDARLGRLSQCPPTPRRD